MAGGLPCSAVMTNSLHEKATLRRDLVSWRGRPFTATEVAGFDLDNLPAVRCAAQRDPSCGRGTAAQYANVASIMRIPKSMNAPTPTDYVRVCHRPKDVAPGSAGTEPDQWQPTDDDVPF